MTTPSAAAPAAGKLRLVSHHTPTPRYAIYFAPPPDSLLHELGVTWLGRDAHAASASVARNAPVSDDLIAEPRRYGFHATLKPPFGLRSGRTEAALTVALAHLASGLDAVTAPSLSLQEIEGFLALVTARPCPALDELAAICVRDLDGFRHPASEDEVQRRRAAGLSKRQDEYLLRWGYPYVMEEFRFHITLTQRLNGEHRKNTEPLAREHFKDVLGQPLVIDALTLFREPAPGHDLAIVQRFALGSPAERRAS
jgi:putative phosphonate metabolism protein